MRGNNSVGTDRSVQRGERVFVHVVVYLAGQNRGRFWPPLNIHKSSLYGAGAKSSS